MGTLADVVIRRVQPGRNFQVLLTQGTLFTVGVQVRGGKRTVQRGRIRRVYHR